MALEALLRAWTGTSYRQIPADSPVGVLDLRFAGRSPDNHWNDPGEPTLYLASDHRVVLAEFGRHFETLRDADFRLRNQARQIYRLELEVDRILDLCDPAVWPVLALPDAPYCFLNKATARATARYVRTISPAQGVIVPSVAFIDDPDRWVLVLFLEKLPNDPRRFILTAEPDGMLRIDP